MGKATITGGGTDGNYTVSVKYDTTAHKATIAKLDQQLSTIAAQISALSPRISTAETELDNAQQALDDAIASKDQAAMNPAIAVMQTRQGMLNALTTEKHVLILQQTAIEKQKEFLNDNVREERSQSAWCADFTEDLSGDVGTIDCGRIDGTVIIKPGFESAAHSAADGQLQDILAMSPAGAYYNYAMITGVAKWKPLYRTGTASAVDKDNDTMSVSLDPINIAGLGCDQGLALSGVAVNYMDCNAEAFESGDGVVIEFGGNFGAPTVIGFSANPKECECEELTLEGPEEPIVGSEYIATGGQGELSFEFDKGSISITETVEETEEEPRKITAKITSINPCEVGETDRGGAISVTDECTPVQSVSLVVRLPGGEWVYVGREMYPEDIGNQERDVWWAENYCFTLLVAGRLRAEFTDIETQTETVYGDALFVTGVDGWYLSWTNYYDALCPSNYNDCALCDSDSSDRDKAAVDLIAGLLPPLPPTGPDPLILPPDGYQTVMLWSSPERGRGIYLKELFKWQCM